MKGCNIYDRRNKTKGGDKKEETKQQEETKKLKEIKQTITTKNYLVR